VEVVRDVAARHGATPAQVALAWVLAQGDDLVPIPGTKRRRYLEENLRALEVRLSADDRRELGELAQLAAGERYAASNAALIER